MIDLFVYGTLRPGETLHHLIDRAVLHSEPFEMPGAFLAYHPCGEYPVMRERLTLSGAPDDNFVVKGDLLTLMHTHDVRDMVAMEILAGYDARWNVNGGREVLAFFWPAHMTSGAYIPSGDWKERSA